jgi:hypothetical protein
MVEATLAKVEKFEFEGVLRMFWVRFCGCGRDFV